MLLRMKELLYVRTEMTIPQVGTSTHLAELRPIDAQACQLLRIIELDPNEAVRGAGTQTTTVGLAAAPEPIVPHPDTYSEFPDITATYLDAADFEALWTETVIKFPELS